MGLTRYEKKLADRNYKPYTTVKAIALGDRDTIIRSTGEGTYEIITPSSSIKTDSNGNINLTSTIKVNGTKLDNLYANSTNSVTRSEWNLNGFENRTDSTLTWTDSEPDRNLAVEPTGGTTFNYWIGGTKYSTEGDWYRIEDTTGVHVIYYSGEALIGIANPTTENMEDVIRNYCLASIVYWNKSSQSAIYVGEERHGIDMQGNTHAYLHFGEGLKYLEGLGLSNILSDETGDVDAHAMFSVDSGKVADENLYLSIDAIPSSTGLPIYYMSGPNAIWYKHENPGFACMSSQTGDNRLNYNKYESSTWSLAEIANNDFVLYHVFATTEKDNPIISIMGQNDYTTKNSARNGAKSEVKELLLNEILFPEIHPIGTIIYQTGDGKDNAVHAEICSTDEGDDYIDWRNESIDRVSVTTSDHGSLTGLTDDDHTNYYNQTRINTISSQANQAYGFSSNSDLFDSSSYMTSSTIISNYYPSSEGNTMYSSYLDHSGNTDLHYLKTDIDLDDLNNVDGNEKGSNEFLIWDGDTWVPSAMTNSILTQDEADALYAPSGGEVSNPIKYFNAVQNSGGTVLGDWGSIPWEEEIKKDTSYSFTSGSDKIKVTADGWYKIDYRVSLINGAVAVYHPKSRLRYYSGAAWHIAKGSLDGCLLNRVTNEVNSLVATVMLECASGNLIDVQCSGNGNVTTYPSGSSILIEKVS